MTRIIFQSTNRILPTLLLLFSISFAFSQGFEGYYQQPALHNETLVFVAEGDLWKVSINGGLAQRLTSHEGRELNPTISPDGQTVAFTASYEGPYEVFTMPITGGLPQRWTYEADYSAANTWTPQGEVVYATRAYSTLPDYQLVKINPKTNSKTQIPLAQASEASFDESGKTVFFVRPAFHNNVTKRYKGGTARQVWKFTEGDPEATQLTVGYDGESHHPMYHKGRVYFITDRDGIMNVWSMTTSGDDLKQHTQQKIFDVREASISNGKIAYRVGADLWLYDIESEKESKIQITLATDLEQLRERWVKNPARYITSAHIHPKGEGLVITARGRVFVAPAGKGRLVQLSRKEGVRFRDAVYSADGDDIIVLSDESGEFEFQQIPSTGLDAPKALTNDGKILRYKGEPSPDGKWLAYDDLQQDMWLLNVETGEQKKISSNQEGIGGFSWSPDSKWLAFEQSALNSFRQIHLYSIDQGTLTPLTTDRANSMSVQWSPDGKWIYFLSDRNFNSLVGSPWGPRQPEAYFDKKMKVYHIALEKGIRSPFKPTDELFEKPEKSKDTTLTVRIDLEGIQGRLQEAPIPAGNYFNLQVNDKAIYFHERETGSGAKTHLKVVKITNDNPKVTTMVEGVRSSELSADGKKMFIRKGSSMYIVAAGTGKVGNLTDGQINLKGWTFSLDPREDWKQLFTDAWRMERDYFYDPNMHGVDWNGMYKRYLPLVDRVTTRTELSDLIGRFVGELSALHTSVWGGDTRSGDDNIRVASLGARFTRVPDQGYRIDYIYQADPDYPENKSPLDQPDLDIQEGDIITHINGENTLSVADMGALLRNTAGKQIRISVKSGASDEAKDYVVTPLSSEYNLRYTDWEYSRRKRVEEKGAGDIGYLHLRAMGGGDLEDWYRDFYPVYNRKGLIIDVRTNRGGNIESLILEKLLRKVWFYWKTRAGEPAPNMQYAFNGHIVVLVNQQTASDGEAFADGFQRLGLGEVIGVRTWGGEIWLSSSNRLSDGGLARAPMMGVYGADGKEWLIEGVGVIPDIEVDNLPHATFKGEDAQLDAAIKHLQEKIAKDPRNTPPAPPFPDKSFKAKR